MRGGMEDKKRHFAPTCSQIPINDQLGSIEQSIFHVGWGCPELKAWLQPIIRLAQYFQALKVIRKGTRWRVGNGQLIHIWEDKWLPTPTTYNVISPPRPLMTSRWSQPLQAMKLGDGKLSLFELGFFLLKLIRS